MRDSRTRSIVYMPPEASDVPSLMKDLVAWISTSQRHSLPCLIRAGVLIGGAGEVVHRSPGTTFNVDIVQRRNGN